jgi:regulator of cell morphogenesis and NO signaling
LTDEELLRYKKMELDSLTLKLIQLHQHLTDVETYNFIQKHFGSDKKFSEVVERLFKDLKLHIYKEEKILFPYLINLSKTKRNEIPFEKPYFETVKNPVEIMKSDHEQIIENIKSLKEFITVENSEISRANECFRKIKNFIEYAEKVIYLENEILFPNSISLENQILLSLK